MASLRRELAGGEAVDRSRGQRAAARAWGRRRSRGAFGKGRERYGEPARPKRQGRSAALVMPMRGPATIATGAGAAAPRPCRRVREAPFEAQVDAERLGRGGPGPAQSRRSGIRGPRRRRITSRPAVGARARISTAAPRPSSSQTRFMHQWMP